MTLFEYLVAAFALLYSLAALRLIGGISAALTSGRRYWPHLVLTLSLLLMIAGGFWTFWSLREVEWTFLGFLIAVAIVGTVYFQAAVLVPENPGQVQSWRAHYTAVRGRFYIGLALLALGMAANATVNLGFPLVHPSRSIQAFSLTMGIVGALSRHDRVHAILAVLVALGVAGLMFTIGLRPGWLLQL